MSALSRSRHAQIAETSSTLLVDASLPVFDVYQTVLLKLHAMGQSIQWNWTSIFEPMKSIKREPAQQRRDIKPHHRLGSSIVAVPRGGWLRTSQAKPVTGGHSRETHFEGAA